MTGFKLQLVTRTAAWLLAAFACAPVATAGMSTPEPPRTPRMEPAPDELKNITVDEQFNGQIPLDLAFTDERNRPVQLGQYFNGSKPVVLQLGYYGCPMLCDLVSRGLTTSLKQVELNAGSDFDIVFVSIDPNESWQLAQGKKRSFLKEYGRAGTENGWHFLTGKADQIERLAKAVGFNYKWVPSVGQFSHPAAITVCTPAGKISRYLYGVQFEEKTLRLSLVEASAGKIGTTVDHFMLTCFQFDGKQGRYAMTAMAVMRLGGVLTMVVLGGTLFVLFRMESRRRAVRPAGAFNVVPGAGGDDGAGGGTTSTNG
jgi:protein SCO1/2